jgi:HK97 family phage prohead protease
MEWQDIILDPRKKHPFMRDEISFRFEQKGAPDYDPETRTFWSTINTAKTDGDKESVLPGGVDPAYFPTIVGTVYLNHNYDAPIGVCRKMFGNSRIVKAQTYLSRNSEGTDVETMIQENILGGMSVGYKTMDAGPPTVEEKRLYPESERIVREWKMVEYSVTGMPCNPDAVIDRKSMEMIDVCLGGIDDLLRAGRIRRKTAVLCGLKEAGKVMTGFTPAKPSLVQRAIEFVVTSGGTLTVG